MGKTIKKYNESTQKWENIYGPEVTIIQQMEDGTQISDTDVAVTNPNYVTEEGNNTTLDETLSVISDDISKLQRNVSWLAEHGGGGGNGGGGGVITSYGIVVTSPMNVTNAGSVYVDETGLTVTFMITGGSQNETCTYTYQYDMDVSQRKETALGKEITVQLDLTKNDKKEHDFLIKATTIYGMSLTFSFKIYRSSLSIWFDTGATTNYENGIFSIMQNDNTGIIPLVMSNGLVGSVTTISVLRGDAVLKTIELPENRTTDNQKLPNGDLPGVRFWDIVPNPSVGEQYVIYIDATARVGNIEAVASRLQVRVKVINPDDLTISFGINGNPQSSEPIEVEVDSTMMYNFKCYAPLQISRVYYAAKIVKNGVAERILGSYYDNDLREEDAVYTDNKDAKVETTVYSQYTLSDMLYNVGDEIALYIKVWGAGSNRITEVSQRIKITESTSEIFPRQYPNRGTYNKGTMLASWNGKNVTDAARNTWTSTVTDYVYMITDGVEGETVGATVINEINVFNGNDNSGLISSTAPRYLRLQNRAYAIADLSRYANEIQFMTSERNTMGFTISLTFMGDDVANVNKTIFLWGENDNATNELVSGIRVDLDKVYWAPTYGDEPLSCNISPGTKHTVDFSYDPSVGIAKIYINGILNIASAIHKEEMYQFLNRIVLGTNYRQSQYENFCDVNIYELSIYTQLLNDVQIIVNSKNARLDGSENDNSVKRDYAAWKIKNFFTGGTADTYFFDTNAKDYRLDYTETQIDYIKRNSNIPTMVLNFSDGGGFTKDYFLSQHTVSETGVSYNAVMTYFDPDTGTDLAGFRVRASLQGTSTLTYRIKNLEIISDETVQIDGETVPVLFQPKKTWFPEKQFTLKADVVDSSHANNAVIGEWINNSSLFSPNPVMQKFESNRPKEVEPDGTARTHKIDGGTEYVDYDENVTIKHTLEGFPILLFIHFDSEQAYSFVGIYSFNLGRFSYYNMGMKFLQCFSRGDTAEESTPRKITYYKEMDNLGGISINDIKSFEFDNEANTSTLEHPTWTQFDPSIVAVLGKYRYPSVDNPRNDSSFNGLCSLFESVARAKISSSMTTKFDGIWPYRATVINDNISYAIDGDRPISQDTIFMPIIEKIDLDNCVAYFIVANAFGMTDSLAKNLTLRTWDNGNKWWPCFYDMDTALGISNRGTEDTPVYVAIDKVTNDPVQGATFEYHDSLDGLGYSGYLSKLWAVFRDPEFMYSIVGTRGNPDYYIQAWADARKTGGDLSTSEKFVSMMADRVETCGEIIYNCDYNSKYIKTDTFTDENTQSAESSTGFLHGTRVEYVRKWLKNHFYFLDGVFDPKPYTMITNTYEDSPYLSSSAFAVGAFYPETQSTIPFKLKSVTPTFVRIGFGNSTGGAKFYIASNTAEETVYVSNASSTNTALFIAGSTLLSQLTGLEGAFRGISNENPSGSLRSLEAFNVNGSPAIQENGVGQFLLSAVKYNNESPLESVNLSNTKAPDTTCVLNLEGLKKVLRVDISYSDVSTLRLPDSSLDYLNVQYSKIGNLALTNQNKLTSISIDGCDSLRDFSITNCDGIQGVSIADKRSLRTFSANNNDSLTSVTINNCNSLSSVEIGGNSTLSAVTINSCSELSTIKLYDNPSLKYVSINGCTNSHLSIIVNGSPLEKIILTSLDTSIPITLPEKSLLSGVKYLEINNVYEFGGFKYGEADVEMYEEENGSEYYVFDATPFVGLDDEGLILRNIYSLKYMRVSNDDGTNKAEPFKITEDSFKEGTKNLVKIFGYIKILTSPFNGMRNFYINHDERYSDLSKRTADFVYTSEDPYYTNVTFDNTDLSAWFSNTNCDINDAYYILFLCDENTEKLNDLFNGCSNVVTDDDVPMRADAFYKCTGVNCIDGIFNGCQIGGTLSSPMYDEHGEATGGNVLLDPLINNLTTFNYVFSGDYKINTIETCFFPEGCRIKTLKGFNPGVSETEYLQDYVLLSNLTDLEVIESCFNKANVDFGSEMYDCTELFRNNTKLVSIKDCFVNISAFGSLRNIFGEYSEEENVYPNALSSITHSFIFVSGNHDSVNGEDGGCVVFPIGNSLFKRIKSTITYIGNDHNSNKTDGDWQNNYNVNCGSFTGPGLKKYLANGEFYIEDQDLYEHDDCDGQDFPYRIFEGCTKLKEIPSLFDGIINLKNYDRENGRESDVFVSIPGRMFDDCEKLTNVSRLFRNMSKSIRCTLTGEGFKDRSIINAESVFQGISVVGQIPFKLFYQEQERSYTESPVVGFTEAQANALGLTGDGGTVGSISSSDYTTFEGTYKAINRTVQNMSSSLSNLTATSMTQYHATVETLDDITEPNPYYNPIKYLLNGSEYVLNNAFNPYKRIWNRFVFDNDENFHVSVTEVIASIPNDEYGYPVVDINELPDEFTSAYIAQEISPTMRSEYFGMSVNDADVEEFAITNYFCPPDIFKYCVNDASTNVAYTLAGGSGEYNFDTRSIKGFRGKIPNSIFEPLTALTAVTGVFSSNVGLYPYRWATGLNIENMGVAYYPNLFAPLSNVADLSAMFSGTKIWGHTAIPETLFNPVQRVTNLSSFWASCTWVTGASATIAAEMLPNSIFSHLTRLTNISYMLSSNGMSSVPNVSQTLISQLNNRSINNVDGFMANANMTRGAVPQFWDWGENEPKRHDGTYRNGQDSYIQGVSNANVIAEHGDYWRAN